MIELRTGTPGACKTLSAVADLAAMLARWEAHPDEARPIFVHGVKDLALPHAPVPMREWRERPDKPAQLVPDWDEMPDGSWVLVDEAQAFFPPRSSQATPPPHVAWLNTHRHRGFDITVITQHPKLVDGSLRALVGKHVHFRRMWGRKFSVRYEWDACSDGLAGLQNAVSSPWPFPRNAFAWYKSAEVHTRQQFKLPKFLFIPVIGLALLGFSVFRALPAFSKVSTSPVAVAASGARPAHPSGSAPVAATALAVASAPARSPVEALVHAVKPAAVAGCIVMAERCQCLDADGRTSEVSAESCRDASVTLGGLIPYDVRPSSARRDSPSSSSSPPVAADDTARRWDFSGQSTVTPHPPGNLGEVLGRTPS